MTEVFAKCATIEKICPHGWAGPYKASVLAAITIAIRPTIAVEIGVWGGQSAIPVALALKEIGRGMLYCIDPWNKAESKIGQTGENEKWWGEVADHELVFNDFLRAMRETGTENCIRIIREASDNVTPPKSIDLLHIDGNHSDQAIKDVERFAANVRVGGFVCADDCQWIGGSVLRAVAKLQSMGFVELYKLGTGALFQRVA